jgi:hypothetical protein
MLAHHPDDSTDAMRHFENAMQQDQDAQGQPQDQLGHIVVSIHRFVLKLVWMGVSPEAGRDLREPCIAAGWRRAIIANLSGATTSARRKTPQKLRKPFNLLSLSRPGRRIRCLKRGGQIGTQWGAMGRYGAQ